MEVTRDTRNPWRKCCFGGQEQFQEEIKSDEARVEVVGPANRLVDFWRGQVQCTGQIAIG